MRWRQQTPKEEEIEDDEQWLSWDLVIVYEYRMPKNGARTQCTKTKGM